MSDFIPVATAQNYLTDVPIQISPTESMTKLDVAALPQWNVHARRLLGDNPPAHHNRDYASTRHEYDKLTYGALLNQMDQIGACVTVDDIRRIQTQRGQENRTPINDATSTQPGQAKTCISLGGDLFEVDLEEAHAIQFDLIVRLANHAFGDCRTVVDLGAGYGYMLHKLREASHVQRNWIGADSSTTAIELARRASTGIDDMRFFEFNFYDPNSYDFLSTVEPPIGLVTRHAIEQLPSATAFLDSLWPYRSSISCVVHFEPIYNQQAETELERLRRRYVETQDYNRDLLIEIRKRDELQLICHVPDVIGINPLNPTTVLQWQYSD